MNLPRHLFASLALVLAAGITGPQSASAQARGTTARVATAEVARTSVHASGTLSHFVLSPLGRVRGLVLNGNIIVFLHGRAAQTMPTRVAPGALLDVDGYAVAGQRSTIHGATVHDGNGQLLASAPPPRAHTPPRRDAALRARIDRIRTAQRERIEHLPNVTASGTVQAILSDRSGTIDGVVFSDGTSIAVGRRLGRQLRAHGLRSGQTLRVAGHGENYPGGESLQAEEVTFADGTMVRVPS
jgi:hypothetical protein